MAFQFSTPIWALLFATAFSSVMSVYVWRRRQNAPAMFTAFVGMAVAIAIWTFFYAIELAGVNYDIKMIGAKLKYPAIAGVPVIWLIFAGYYTKREHLLTRRNMALLFILPTLTIVLTLTNELHHLIWDNITLEMRGSLLVVASDGQIWFWVHAAYSYVMMLVGTVLMINAFVRSRRIYRGQLAMLLLAVLLPWFGNLLTLTQIVRIDLTPFAFTVTMLLMYFALFRYRMLELRPVARDRVMDMMEDIVLVVDKVRRIVDANPAARRVLRSEKLIGQTIEAVLAPFTEPGRVIDQYSDLTSVHDEIVFGEGDQRRYFDLRVSTLTNRRQDIEGRVIVLRDITEHKQAEKQIRKQNEALMQANEELAIARQEAEAAAQLKSQFLATMSHELRTPLNAIIGYTEIQLAGMTGELNQEQLDYQQRVLINAEHLLTLINDVLDLSKIEAGRMDLARKPFSVRDWLGEVVQQVRGLAEDKQLQIYTIIDETMPDNLIGDSPRLKQIALNLLSNAIKFTDTGNVKIELQRPNDTEWQLIISDSGIGIPPHMQETVFEEFRQVDGSYRRQYRGTGLGLAIVRKLTTMMNGSIRLQSQVNEGSTFTLTFPLLDITEATDVPSNGKEGIRQ